ncbi:sulfonate ABC transporter substrate-binding protein [Hyphomicrobium sp.]|jgi:sulfonate transport system substrate-binding protein|uniref:sulfonate ABC transporter substrate-binding protein n=1 Tax=Hyphomicrobium sp. TaxID=82 RepID=UPI002CB0DC6B|nr:sulfonate ABC transporter substrate-binding protein [Hyphomicrobium sp.]HVZ03979.1 sulfonate ABC transporter substrate-binding protein [Hyphomicrobium sp.]
MNFTRRTLGALTLGAIAVGLAAGTAGAEDKIVRIGYQKYGNVILLKNKGTLEGKLAPLGYKVEWSEFPSGPPLIEALNAGAIDFGHAGEAPPIFAQAASAQFVYVAHEPPAPKGEAILVPKNSPLKSVADLKGKKVALNKGSNVHYLLVKALEKAGVSYADIHPQFLAPADARAAFESGQVDAWVIWDPYQASAEVATGAKTLRDGTGLVANTQFYLASKSFVQNNPKAIEAVIAALKDVDESVKGNTNAAAKELSAAIGIPVPVLEIALNRQSYDVKPIDDTVIADQQKIADTFFKLGLIPKAINVKDIAWRAGS